MATDATVAGDLESQIRELRAQLQELRDKDAIRDRLQLYAFLVDSSRWRDIPEEIFTEDAVDYHMPEMVPPLVPRGRAELHEFFDRVMAPAIARSDWFADAGVPYIG